jgi:1,4-dihydroxy-2-naphthoyl-CoA hydrolase
VSASLPEVPDDEPWHRGIAAKGMAGALGVEFVEISERQVIATMPVDDRTRQPFGLLHGGASLALAETVASVGALASIDRSRFMAVGQEINGNHLRPKTEGVVTATARPIHVGRTSHVWGIEIADEAGRLVCVSRCTMAIIPRERA